mgnify:CR=1 FL=1
MQINIDLFDYIIDGISFIFTWLNSITIGGLFSLLDFNFKYGCYFIVIMKK